MVEKATQHVCGLLITLARLAESIMFRSVRSVFFYSSLNRTLGRILNVTHQGAAHDAASEHFRPIIRTDTLAYFRF